MQQRQNAHTCRKKTIKSASTVLAEAAHMSPIGAHILHELEVQLAGMVVAEAELARTGNVVFQHLIRNEIQQFHATITAKRHVAYITPAAAEVEISRCVTAESLGKDEAGEGIVCGQKVLQALGDSAALVVIICNITCQPELAPGSLAARLSQLAETTLQISCLVTNGHPHKDSRHGTVSLQSITLVSKATGTESPANCRRNSTETSTLFS